MFRNFFALAIIVGYVPSSAAAEDLTHTEKQLQDRLAVMERNISFLEKQLELAKATHDLEKKKLEISEVKRERAEEELATSQANAERLAGKISKVDATVQKVSAPDETCNASPYVLFHCKGKPRCEFDLNTDEMCKLPADTTEDMLVSVTFRCSGARDFANETFPFNAPKGFLTCF